MLQDDHRNDKPQALLESEGVTFQADKAAPAQRLTAADLATLVGMDTSAPVPSTQAQTGVQLESEVGSRFLRQLVEARPQAADGVLDVLAWWQSLGGDLSFGSYSETTCFLIADLSQHVRGEIWPFAIYPQTGTVEVVFQHMRRRPVFEDPTLREEFRQRLERADVVIPPSKLNLRPSFPLEILSDATSRDAIKSALEWFVMVLHARLN